ncbi:hypothetical protein [Pseudolactococcus raffinolactis]|uniref:hypothetical protein n=1 Tax=Pseudolactococcus raffinolactis TaxID=1366 RepID=UPI001436BE33|nr:hypothetical protein [Lactococcus raffinolactis]QIW51743.1 hypothetical protein GU337_07575 [Lactococcus raffinolactis]
MALQGYQFDKAKVTPEADAALYSYLAQSSDNKVISGLTVTATGLNVYVASGKALVQGRLVEVTQQHQLTAQANKSGYICITVDLTQDNTSTGTPGTSNYLPVNNQLRIELVEVLNQQDLNSGGGLIYTFPLYSYVSTGTSVSLTKTDRGFDNATIAYFSSTDTTITFTAPWDCTVEIYLTLHGWGFGGGGWGIGIDTPAGLTKLYEAIGYTEGHNSQAVAMSASAGFSNLRKGQQYSFSRKDVIGGAGGLKYTSAVAKLNRI